MHLITPATLVFTALLWCLALSLRGGRVLLEVLVKLSAQGSPKQLTHRLILRNVVVKVCKHLCPKVSQCKTPTSHPHRSGSKLRLQIHTYLNMYERACVSLCEMGSWAYYKMGNSYVHPGFHSYRCLVDEGLGSGNMVAPYVDRYI